MNRTLIGFLSAITILVSTQTATAGIMGPFMATAEGTASFEGDSITLDTNVNFQEPDLGLLTFFAEITVVGEDNPFDISGFFTIDAIDGILFGELNGTLFVDLDSGFASSSGLFEITSGTGIFANVTGTGVFTTLIDLASGHTRVMIAGSLIPAPGAFAGLAMLGLLTGHRRRRAA